MNPLEAFEATARLNSLTLDAEELDVSQVAACCQVKVLEEYRVVALFRRLHCGIEVSREGQRLFDGVS